MRNWLEMLLMALVLTPVRAVNGVCFASRVMKWYRKKKGRWNLRFGFLHLRRAFSRRADIPTLILNAAGAVANALSHSSVLYEGDVEWGSVDKTELPLKAFAWEVDGTDKNKKSTWKYPHHIVVDGEDKAENGVYTTGDLLLHRGGLTAATSRAVQQKNAAALAHLNRHRRALGLDPAGIGNSRGLMLASINTSAAIARQGTLEGRDVWIVPMVMLVEGVHNGSEGPYYYPEEEIAKIPACWNGRPVVVYHPKEPSANTPEYWDRSKIGVVMNTTWEDGKLKAEAWIYKDTVEQIDKRVHEAIVNGDPLELSTGLFADTQMEPGEWNGEEYVGIVRNFRPDHLAVLPDMTGACSMNDGAGFMRNHAFILNQMSFDEKEEAIRDAVLEQRGDDKCVWILAGFEDHVIYEVSTPGEPEELYRQDYTMEEGEDNQVTLVGLPVKVERQVEFVPVANNEGDAEMEREKQVAELIKNGAYEESQRQFLMDLEDDNFTAVYNASTKKPEDPPAGDPPKDPKTVDNDDDADDTKKPTFGDLLQNADPADREAIEYGKRRLAADRAELVGTILENTRNPFSKEELEGKSIGELEKLATLSNANRPSRTGAGDFGVGSAPDGTEIKPLGMLNSDDSEQGGK